MDLFLAFLAGAVTLYGLAQFSAWRKWRGRPIATFPKAMATQEEINLIRHEGECLISSYRNLLTPDLPDEQQDPGWHDGKKLVAWPTDWRRY